MHDSLVGAMYNGSTGLGCYRVGRRPLLGRGVVGVTADVKLVRWEKVDGGLLEALKDGA